jgi:hypothetical protein
MRELPRPNHCHRLRERPEFAHHPIAIALRYLCIARWEFDTLPTTLKRKDTEGCIDSLRTCTNSPSSATT